MTSRAVAVHGRASRRGVRSIERDAAPEIEMLPELLRTAAARTPEAIAVVCGDERVSYGELWRRVVELAAELADRGLSDGTCASIVLPNGPDFAAALFAIAMVGGVAQPLAPALETAELARWLADAAPVLVIASEATRSRCRAALDGADLGASLLTCGRRRRSADHSRRVDDRNQNDTLIDGSDSVLESVPVARAFDGRGLHAPPDGSRRALYLYTSGSEGLRKRVCRTQANLHHEAMGFVTSAGLGPDDTVLCLVPLHHSYGLGNGLLAAIGAGSTLVLLPPSADGQPEAPFAARCREVVDLAATERARLFVAVAYQYDLLAELPRGQAPELATVRLCISSGNRLPDDVHDRFLARHGHPIRQLYGSTETGSIAANLAPDGRSQAGSVGTCLAGVSVRIVDDRGADVPEGEVGTILVESPVLPPGGYDGEPEATAAAFRDGAYRTGDRGLLDPAGVLHIVGRKQTFIDTGGYKVDPAQVEAVLRQHPAVREVAVLAIDAGGLGQIVTAFVAAAAGTGESELDRFCRTQMAPYKAPRAYRLLDALPRTALGKVAAEELRAIAGPAERRPDEPGASTLLLDVGGTFTLDRLGWRRSPAASPGPGEVEIEVACAGLNFLDVLLALGEIPDDGEGARSGAPRLGCECVGRVVRTGPGVRAHAVGDRVIAVFPGTFAVRVCVPEALVAPAPRGLADELAAALPIAHVTAHHALLEVGSLAPGERVLVHAAAGGVGLAAIQVARARGAEVIATAGSEEKRAHLRGLGVEHVLDSRSTAYAAAIRELTGGDGVDVVLNSLAGEHIPASLGLLRDYGRFVEIGKRDYYADTRIGLRPFLRQIQLGLVDLRGMMFTRRDVVSRALRDVVRLAEEGTYRPHVDRVFPAGRALAAFQHLVAARQIGKVVLDLCSVEEVPDDETDAAGAGPRGELARALAACPEQERGRLAEARLVQELAAVLKADPAAIDRRAPLRSIGLDSLTAILLRNRLAELLGADLPVTLLFEHADARGLAGALAARCAPGEPAVVPRSPVGRAATGPDEPIAIVGIGCRLPGGVGSAGDYWRLLWNGVDAIAPVPPERWPPSALDAEPDQAPVPRWGGFLDRVDGFDAGFFGIAAREASAMDPQQRLLLELAWEALEDAGLAPDSLAGSATGVFVGISFSDYGARGLYTDLERVTPYSTTGGAFSIAAGRISYVLGLTGPSIAVDTACSSSLAAVHLACQSLRAGECTAALVGGVNLVLEPHAGVSLGKMEALAADGRCKPFDASADGIVRSEGGAVIALRPLSDALRDGDRVYGVVLASASNQDGRTSSLTAPSGRGQEALLRRAVAAAGIEPAQVGYLEAHGTGTRLGDPIEVHAAGAVLGARDPARPLWIGSVKGNLGHTEACAGIAGLIKAVLALHHRVIPASLHFRRPNPHIDWARLPIRVASARTTWDVATGERRIAGVSSFGFSGTNVHVLVKEAP